MILFFILLRMDTFLYRPVAIICCSDIVRDSFHNRVIVFYDDFNIFLPPPRSPQPLTFSVPRRSEKEIQWLFLTLIRRMRVPFWFSNFLTTFPYSQPSTTNLTQPTTVIRESLSDVCTRKESTVIVRRPDSAPAYISSVPQLFLVPHFLQLQPSSLFHPSPWFTAAPIVYTLYIRVVAIQREGCIASVRGACVHSIGLSSSFFPCSSNRYPSGWLPPPSRSNQD